MARHAVTLRARRIAVVGAGPSGLAAAKYLRAEKAFDKIVLFEHRRSSGGLWNHTPDQTSEDIFTIPQTDPKGQNQDPLWKNAAADDTAADGKIASFLSPIYEELETNIPRGLMGFKGLDWPQNTPLFPKHRTVLEYIQDYGRDVQGLIQYETQVINAEPTSNEPNSTWNVTVRNLRTKKVTKEIYDAIIVASGRFTVPNVPDVPGIREWNKQYPGSITHSKYYRRPVDFANKKVVVVGNAASGADISDQIANHCQTPLIWSARSFSPFSANAAKDPRRKVYGALKRFLPSTRSVEMEDGTIIEDVDAILFATGYFYSLPFLEHVKPALITDGSHVENTYQHLFYAPQPTLSFLVLNQRIVPFPIAEAQSAVLARVYSGRLALPSLQDMQAWHVARRAEIESDRNFHLLLFPKDGEYINMLSTWALSAPPRSDLDNDGKGKIPPLWGDREFWCREHVPAIRGAFGMLEEERKKHITRIEEVGFDYEQHLKKQNGDVETDNVITG